MDYWTVSIDPETDCTLQIVDRCINYNTPCLQVEFLLEGWNDMPPMRRDFDTVKYCEDTYDFRPGREHVDPKEVRAKFQAEQKRLKAENTESPQ